MPQSSTPVAAGGQNNRLSSKNLPIIFIPGVMGSRLVRPSGQKYWDPDQPSVMLDLLMASASQEGMLLDSATRARVMREAISKAGVTSAENSRGWGGPSWDFYGSILRFLQNQSQWNGNRCNVYALGYDWRQCNELSGKRLRAFINTVLKQETGAEKVILVTHSMGGMVARSACKGGAESQVAGVVHVVQPVAGAVAAYRRFKTGARTKFEDGSMVFVRLLGNTAHKYQRVAAGLVGPAQLMPTNHHPRTTRTGTSWVSATADVVERYPVSGTSKCSDVYEMYAEQSGSVGLFNHSEDGYVSGRIKTSIAKAKQFHRNLGLWKHPNTYVIAVNGYETDVACSYSMTDPFFGSPKVELDEDFTNQTRALGRGDKTVPIVSQTALDVPTDRTYIFPGQSAPDHAEVFSSSAINRKVAEFVRRIIAAN